MTEQPSTPAAPPTMPSSKPMPTWLKVLLALFVGGFIVMLIASTRHHATYPAQVSPIQEATEEPFPTSSTVLVIYEVEGTATSADITYVTPSGMAQQVGVDVPLTMKDGTVGIRFVMPRGEFVSISAQNRGGGTITCRIFADATQIAVNTSSGEYAIASCDGSVPD